MLLQQTEDIEQSQHICWFKTGIILLRVLSYAITRGNLFHTMMLQLHLNYSGYNRNFCNCDKSQTRRTDIMAEQISQPCMSIWQDEKHVYRW